MASLFFVTGQEQTIKIVLTFVTHSLLMSHKSFSGKIEKENAKKYKQTNNTQTVICTLHKKKKKYIPGKKSINEIFSFVIQILDISSFLSFLHVYRLSNTYTKWSNLAQ